MPSTAFESCQRVSVLEIEGVTLTPSSPDFAGAIAKAYGRRRRPYCLCHPDGIEMYVARLGDGFVVKRMPETGCRHAPDCPSYEPPAELSGLRHVLGSAVKEDPNTGTTTLRLGFSLSRRPPRTAPAKTTTRPCLATSATPKLSMRGLLHYLWDQAELTRWHPGFEGRRSWGTVRRQLLSAGAQMVTGGESLATLLYVPEPFSVERRDAIIGRRHKCWSRATFSKNASQRLFLVIAEVKEILPARHGHKAVIKHVPDLAFAMEDSLYNLLGKRFERELELWSASDSINMIMIATVVISAGGLPHIVEISLMTATAQWLPVRTISEQQLIESLVGDKRAFRKLLSYDARPETRLASVSLTDRGLPAPLVFASDAEAMQDLATESRQESAVDSV